MKTHPDMERMNFRFFDKLFFQIRMNGKIREFPDREVIGDCIVTLDQRECLND